MAARPSRASTREHSGERRKREESLQEYDALQAASGTAEGGEAASKVRKLWVTGKRDWEDGPGEQGWTVGVGKRPRTDEDDIVGKEGGRGVS